MITPPAHPTIITTRRVVPNHQPVAEPHPYRIAIIGEAPGEDEENYMTPFVGRSGQLLNSLLKETGIDRNRVFVGNVCQVRPPGNDITRFPWNGPEISDGIAQLSHDLSIFHPHICVLLGNTPLRAALGRESKISDWCGSLFTGPTQPSPFFSRKCIAGFHPAGILREWGSMGNFPRLKLTLQRARAEGEVSSLILPHRELITDWTANILVSVLDSWPSGQRCSLDIEGGLDGWPCVSICARPTRSITIAFGKFDPTDHARVLQSFARLMARTDVPKVLQNSLYDNFVLSYGFGIPIRNVVEDTMLKGWEIYCELPKSLGVQASIWTREPFYKTERKSDDVETFYRYCAKDSAVTLELCEAQDNALSAQARAHYEANVAMLNPLLYMQIRGINYDQENVSKKLKETKLEIEEVGSRLNAKAGAELRGEKGSLSSKRLAKALYETLGYPPQYKKEFGRKGEKLTTDVEAILNLRKKLPGDEFLNGVLRHRHLEGILETLDIQPDPDGRVRCGYNVVGTETGRITCYTSPTGAGANLQTITKSLRSNYRADPSYDFFQCDLSGADGWTVAAHCARLGDRTMLEDYIAGLKPAKIVSGLYCFGGEFNQLDRESLSFWGGKTPFNAISKASGSGIYDCAKIVQHGSNYLMGIPTMQTNVMKRSFKETGTPIYMEHSDARRLQDSYFTRYSGVRLWHSWAESTLVSRGSLTSASGHTRIFFGRRFGKDIHDTVKEFLADEPQQNTTWATNLAMLALWRDPANRVARVDRGRFMVYTVDGASHYWSGSVEGLNRIVPGSLLIEPLHQVHDALCGQWPTFLRDWAKKKVSSYFNNVLTIAGIPITIPFEGGYGPSWGECKNPI